MTLRQILKLIALGCIFIFCLYKLGIAPKKIQSFLKNTECNPETSFVRDIPKSQTTQDDLVVKKDNELSLAREKITNFEKELDIKNKYITELETKIQEKKLLKEKISQSKDFEDGKIIR